MQRKSCVLSVVIGLMSPAVLVAQQGTSPCAGDEHRKFDFWLGDWDVTVVGSGQVAGTNEITRVLGGCVLYESYSTPTGYVGNSFNAYDRTTGSWHQTWVDNAGTVLKLDGGIVDGKMVLSGPAKDQQGNDIINQITWTPHDDGAVQQTWLVSSDGGATWTTSFDGMYMKKPGS